MPILGGCLCFDLPTGSKIIGGLYLFSSLVNTLILAFMNLLLWALDMVPQLLDILESAIQQQNQETFHSGHHAMDDDYEDHSMHMASNNSSQQTQEDMKKTLELIRDHIFAVKVAFLVLLCMAILGVVSASLLLHGVRKNRRGLLVPWILHEIVNLLVGVVVIVVVFILFGAAKVAWTFNLPVFIGMFVQVFFIIVVVSQFQALGLIRMHDEMCMK